ncbi:MAG TPA: FCD domain-containing protein [Vicinamibacterales bacterium]|nr:FCD domain-containing protein [Vicinamibacterales bacterium]
MPAGVGRQARVSEAIVHRIKKQITEGRLLAGHKLPAEREMARQFKTSRVSVREAYRSLEEVGVLRIRRGADGGAFVAQLDHEPVLRSLALVLGLGRTSHRELTEARMLIEPPIARLAALRARKDDILRIERVLLQEEHDAAQRSGPFRPTDSRFHRSVADCTRNLPLIVLMNALADLTANAASALDVSTRARHRLKNCQFHRQLFDAIRTHDGEKAYATMARHVGDIQRRVRRSLARRRK